MRSRIASRANLHGFEAQSAHFVQHFIQRKIFVDGIENADGNFARLRCGNRGSALRSGLGTQYGFLHLCASRNGRGQQAAARRG